MIEAAGKPEIATIIIDLAVTNRGQSEQRWANRLKMSHKDKNLKPLNLPEDPTSRKLQCLPQARYFSCFARWSATVFLGLPQEKMWVAGLITLSARLTLSSGYRLAEL